MADSFEILGVVFIIVNWLIICPFCVFYSLLYFKKMQMSAHSKILKLRQPGTIKMNLIIICYFLLFEQTITLFQTFNLIPSIPSIVSLCITLPTYCLVFYSGIIRAWLLYYDQFIDTATYSQYKHNININKNDKNKNKIMIRKHNNNNSNSNRNLRIPNQRISKYGVWFGNHRNTLGNTKFLYSFLLIIYITSIILLLIFGYIYINTKQHAPNTSITIKQSYIYLCIVQLLIIVSPIILSSFILIIICFCNKHSSSKSKTKSHLEHHFHITLNILQNLDKETIIILIWTIISCSLRLIISIFSNLIVMHIYHANTSIAYTQYEYIYNVWNYDTSQFTGIYILYTIWAILSVFILHLFQTRRALYIVNELDWFNLNLDINNLRRKRLNHKSTHKKPTPSNSSMTRNSMSQTRTRTSVSDVAKHINIIHVTGDMSEEDTDMNAHDKECDNLLPHNNNGTTAAGNKIIKTTQRNDKYKYTNLPRNIIDDDDDIDDMDMEMEMDMDTADSITEDGIPDHAEIIYQNIYESGNRDSIKCIDAPNTSWSSHSHSHVHTRAHSNNDIDVDVDIDEQKIKDMDSLEAGFVKCSADYSKIRKVYSETDRDEQNGKRWKNFMKILNRKDTSKDIKEEVCGDEYEESETDSDSDEVIKYSKTMCDDDDKQQKKIGLNFLSKSNKTKSDNTECENANSKLNNVKQKLKQNECDEFKNSRRIEIPFNELLLFKEGYNLFMNHLAKEYSTENLSFLTEVCQFKQRFCMDLLHDAQWIYHAQVLNSPFGSNKNKCDMKMNNNTCEIHEKRPHAQSLINTPPQTKKSKYKNKNKNKNKTTNSKPEEMIMIEKINKIKKQLEFEHSNSNKSIYSYDYKIAYGWCIQLSRDVPLSEILTDDHWRSFYSKAHKLFKKYIEQGSDSEINISYNCRNLISKYFNNNQNIPRPFSNHNINNNLNNLNNNNNSSYSERDIFSFDQQSIDSHHSHHSHHSYNSYNSHFSQFSQQQYHSHDDLSRFKRRGSLTFVDESFRGLKKSRSFHNVFEADSLYLDENDEHTTDTTTKKSKSKSKSTVKLHDVSNTNNILDKLDENAYLLQIFDDASEEIYGVLRRDSLNRFYETEIYNQKLVAKYLKKKENLSLKMNENNKNNHDIRIIFYYYCQCNKNKNKSKKSKCECECKHTSLKRETFESKAKKLKKKGIKRKKPLFRMKQKCENKMKTNMMNITKNEKLKIIRQAAMDMSQFGNLSTPINKNIYSHSPVSISRRSSKLDAQNQNQIKNIKNIKTMQKNSSAISNNTTNWKLDITQDNIMHYYDENDIEYDNSGVPIVRIVNVNINTNTIPPPPPLPKIHSKTANVYSDNKE